MVPENPKKALPAGSLLLSLYLVIYAAIASTSFFKEYSQYFQGLVLWVVLALIVYYFLEMYAPGGDAKRKRNHRLRIGVILFLCTLLVILPTILEVLWRVDETCDCYVHDSLLQNEVVVRFVAQGKNPYEEEYKGTRLESWHLAGYEWLENPALYHYTYMPVTFLIPLPFQLLFENLFDWFDQRLVLILAYLAVLAFCLGFRISPEKKTTLLIALGLNPFISFLIVPGYNDILVLFWIVLCVYALRFDRPYLSAIAFGLACASKQYAWIFVPFYFFYLGGDGSIGERIKRAWRPLLVFSLVFGLFTLPWVIDNPMAFVQDVLGYHSGVVLHSYPINGFSLASLLHAFSVIENATDNFPTYAFQLVFVVPLMFLLLYLQRRDNTLPRAMLNYAILMAVVIFFARAGNMNHWGYAFCILSMAILVRPQEPIMEVEEQFAFERELQKA